MFAELTRASCIATTLGRSSAAATTSSSTLLRPRDPPAQEERRARLDARPGRGPRDAQDLAGGRHDREVAEAAIEHLEQHVAAEPVGAAGVRRRRHRGRDGRVAGQPARDDPCAQVAVGEDPERPVAELDDHATWPRRPSSAAPPRGSASRARRRPARRGSARRRAGRAGRRAGLRSTSASQLGRGLEQRAGDEPQARRAPTAARAAISAPDPVAQRVLGGPRLEPGGKPRQHRRVPEQLALAQQVEHATVVDDLDRRRCGRRAGARPAPRPCREDRRPGAVELDLDAGRDPLATSLRRARRTADAAAGSG